MHPAEKLIDGFDHRALAGFLADMKHLIAERVENGPRRIDRGLRGGTRHAANAVIDRKLEIEWLDRTVNDADASERDRVWPDAVRAFKVIPESDGRVLRVVYVP